MSLYNAVKDLANLARKADDAELHRAIATLNLEAAESTTREANLTTEIAKLKDALDLREALEFKDNVYWLPKEEGSRRGPYCQPCWDNKDRLVHLHSEEESTYWACKVCNTCPDKPGMRQQRTASLRRWTPLG